MSVPTQSPPSSAATSPRRRQVATPRRRHRRLLVGVGVALVLAGLGVLGYVSWQLVGTTVVAHHRMQQVVERTEQDWAAPARGRAGATARVSGVDLHGAQALVRIPRFGRSYVVPVQQGVSADVLAEGFGHLPGTARPGQVGNYAIAGHRVTHGEPLRDMPALRPGDRVVVSTRTRTFTYRVDTDPDHLVVPFSDAWVLDALPTNPHGGVEPEQRRGQRLLTMTTCAELFHTDQRMVVFGHLVESAPRT